jgi:Protein of unknown function with PCYCGC motif
VSWLAIALFAAAAAGCQSQEPAATSVASQPVAGPPPAAAEGPVPTLVQFTPPPAAYEGELPPLPSTPYMVPRPPEVVRAVYTFAARHPEVLHYVPCFCGCQNSGHKDNDDCFIQSRDANGRPTWEPHGMT